MHTVIHVDEHVSRMMWFNAAPSSDHVLLQNLKTNDDTFYVFVKGYNDYKVFMRFSQSGSGFVTRIKDNAVNETLYNNPIGEGIHSGVLKDQLIEMTVKDAATESKLKLRKIRFYDRAHRRELEFLTNLFEMRPDLISAIYMLRWQIELCSSNEAEFSVNPT